METDGQHLLKLFRHGFSQPVTNAQSRGMVTLERLDQASHQDYRAPSAHILYHGPNQNPYAQTMGAYKLPNSPEELFADVSKQGSKSWTWRIRKPRLSGTIADEIDDGQDEPLEASDDDGQDSPR